MTAKKILIGAGAVATILIGGASLVIAQNDTSIQPSTTVVSDSRPQPMIVNIGPGGKTLLRGEIKTVGSSSLTVKSWGGDWIINISSSTQLMPKTDISQFAVGDFIGVQGMVNQSASLTIDATLVRNWTAKRASEGDGLTSQTSGDKPKKEDSANIGNRGVQGQIQAILEQIKKIQAQIDAQ